MDERLDLMATLEEHYRGAGWPVERGEDGTLRASGPCGVTWIGTAITSEDLGSDGLARRIVELSDVRMPGGGELCPLDLLPVEGFHEHVERLLDELGLGERPHISVYSFNKV